MKIKKVELAKLPLFNSLLFGGGILLALLINLSGFSNSLGSSYASFLVILLPLFLFAIILLDRYVDKRKIEEYGFRPLKADHLSIVLYSFLAVFPLAFLSRVLTPHFDIWYSTYFPLLSLNSLLSFLAFSMPLGVIAEEFGERALFQSRLSKLFGSRAAVYVVTFNFLMLHLQTILMGRLEYSLMTLFTILLYSLLISLVFEYTKSIYATLLLHFLINLVSSVQIFLHLNSLLIYEVLLWSIWAALFLLNFKSISKMLKRITIFKEVRLPAMYEFYLFLLALPYPLFMFILLYTNFELVIPLVLLIPIILYYFKSFIQ